MWRWCFKKSNVAGLTKKIKKTFMVEKFVDLVSLVQKKKEKKKSCDYLPVLKEMGKPSSKAPARRTNEKIKKNETRITERKGLVICFGVQSYKRGGDR